MSTEEMAVYMRCRDRLAAILATATMPPGAWGDAPIEWRQLWWDELARRAEGIRAAIEDLKAHC